MSAPDLSRMVPVLCIVQQFTAAAVVLQTANEDDAAPGELTFTVAQSLVILQTVDSWNTRNTTISTHMLASTMTSEQQADSMLVDLAIAWIPLWKFNELGVTSMEPTPPEVTP